MAKNLKDLDDIESVLKQNRTRSAPVSRNRQARQKKKVNGDRTDRRDLIMIACIPILILILMIVIVIADRRGGHSETSLPEQQETTTVQDETAESEELKTEDQVTVYNDEIMTAFFDSYFKARLASDTETLYAMTGMYNQTEEQKTLFKEQLDKQAEYIEAYKNIRQYAVNGLEKNSKLVFVLYDICFRRVNTPAPGIMYCYVTVNEKNEFQIVENLNADQTKFVNSYITDHEEVQELINTVNSRLLQSITEDARLAVVYDAMLSGRLYDAEQNVLDSEVSLVQ